MFVDNSGQIKLLEYWGIRVNDCWKTGVLEFIRNLKM